MTEESYKFWDILVKALGFVGIIAGGLWAVYKQLDTIRARTSASFMEARKPFASKQLDLYLEVCHAASQIANSGNESQRDLATARFWELYWGPMALVEDGAVESAMVRLGDRLEGKPGEFSLKRLALDLAYACRQDISKSWLVSMPDKRARLIPEE